MVGAGGPLKGVPPCSTGVRLTALHRTPPDSAGRDLSGFLEGRIISTAKDPEPPIIFSLHVGAFPDYSNQYFWFNLGIK